jgi:hypothetical protein
MSSASNSVQYGTPIPAPLLRIHGAGPRYDVPGTQKPRFGTAVETVKPQKIEPTKGRERETENPGVGQKVDITA